MLAYWMENVIIGFYTVLKIAKAEAPNPSSAKINNLPIKGSGKFFMIPFFIMHFGIFTIVHGVFVVALFGLPSLPDNTLGTSTPIPELLNQIDFSVVGFFTLALSLLISHGISYKSNFIGKKEYLQTSPSKAMMAPYGRVIVMHLVLLGSGFIMTFVGFNTIFTIMVITAKVALDYVLHYREHAKYSLP